MNLKTLFAKVPKPVKRLTGWGIYFLFIKTDHCEKKTVAGAVRIELTTFGFGDRRSAN